MTWRYEVISVKKGMNVDVWVRVEPGATKSDLEAVGREVANAYVAGDPQPNGVAVRLTDFDAMLGTGVPPLGSWIVRRGEPPTDLLVEKDWQRRPSDDEVRLWRAYWNAYQPMAQRRHAGGPAPKGGMIDESDARQLAADVTGVTPAAIEAALAVVGRWQREAKL